MAFSIGHSLTATTPADPGYEIQTGHWNQGHVISGLGTDPYISPQQLVQVSKDATVETGKWYNSVKSACDYAATVALTGNRIVVLVYPGEYTESPFTIPAFTHVTGLEDWPSAHIITNDVTLDFVTLSASSAAHRIAVSGPTTAGKAAFRMNVSGTAKLTWINVRVGDYGVYCSAGRIMCIGVVNDTGTTPSRMFCADGTGALALTTSHCMVGTWTSKFGVHISGSARALLDLCIFRCSGGTALFVDGSAYLRGNSCSLVSGATGVQHEGSASTVHLSGCDIAPGGFTTDILCNGVGTSAFTFSGYATHTKISHTGSITPILNFADAEAGHPGQHTFGEAYIGPDIATGSTPLTSFIDAVAQTGKYSGGGVTRSTGLDVSVAAGSAMFDSGNIIKRVDWGASTVTLAANTDEIWVTVDNVGTVSSTTTEPNPITTVILAQAVTDATDVMFLSGSVVDLGNLPERVTQFHEHAIGAYISEGGIVSASGLGFDVSTGTSFIAVNKTDFTATTTASFYYWRRDGAGGWIQTAAQTAVNATQYDDGSGTLATMTANFYRGDMVFICHPNGGKEFHVVIGQSEHATPSQAKLSFFTQIPDVLQEYSARLALLIVQKSGAALSEVQDKRALGQAFQIAYPPHNILSAGTQVANVSGLVNFANSNNFTFGMSGNSQITASYSQSNPNLSAFATGNTTQSSSGTLNATNLLFNGAGNVSVGVSNGSILISGGTASPSPIVVSAGTSSASISSLVLSDSNGISFGLNGSTITASHNALTTAAQSNHSHGNPTLALTNLNGTTASASNGFTLSLSASAQTNQSAIRAFGVSNTGQTAGNTGVSTGIDWVMAGSQSITLSQSTAAGGPNTVWVQHPAWLTTAMASNRGSDFVAATAAFAGTNASGTIASNGISVSVNAGGGDAIRGIAANGSTASTNTVHFSNLNGISFGFGAAGNSTVMTASHNALTTARASNDAIGLNTAQTNVTWTANSAGLSFNAGGYAGTTTGFAGANISGSMTHNTAGLNLSLSVAAPGAAAEANWIHALGANTAGNTTVSGSTLGFSGLNLTLSGTNNSQLVISAPPTSSLVGMGGISLSTNGSTISVSRSNASAYDPFEYAEKIVGQHGQATLHVYPLQPFGNVQHDRIGVRMVWSNSSNSTGSATISNWFGLYTKNASTLSLVSSTSTSNAITFSGTVGNFSLQHGMRNLTIPWTNTITDNHYWMGHIVRTTTAGGNGTYNQILVTQLASAYSGVFGVASNATAQVRLGHGVYTASTTGIPASIGFSQINGTASLAQRPPMWFLTSGTV